MNFNQMTTLKLSQLSKELQARVRKEVADFIYYVATPAADKLEQDLGSYLSSIIKETTLTDRLLPIDSFLIRKVEEQKIEGYPTGNFDVELSVRKAGYLPARFIKGLQKDLEHLLKEWSEENVKGEVTFNIITK